MPQAKDPLEVLKKVNDNANKVDLPSDNGVSTTFNVADLSPYWQDDYLADLGQILLNKGKMMEVH